MKKTLMTRTVTVFTAAVMLTSGVSSLSAFAESMPAETTVISTTDYTPQKVSGFKVSAYTLNSITLKWDAVSDATGYQIYIYNTKTRSWSRLASITKNSKTSYTLSKLSAASQQRFCIKSYKKVDGKTYWSPYTELRACTKPNKVTNLSVSKSISAIRLKWSKVAGATGYQVYQLNEQGSYTKLTDITDANTTEYRISGLNENTKYTFKVRAFVTPTNGSKKYYGECGKISAVTKSTTAPKQITGLTGTVSKTSVTLNWNKASCKGYQIQQKIDGSWKTIKTISNSSTVKYKVSNLLSGTKYSFRVRGYNVNQSNTKLYGKYSSATSVTTKKETVTEPKHTRVTSSSVDGTSCTLTWQQVDCSGYEIWMFGGATDYAFNNYELYRKAVDIPDGKCTTATVKDLCENSIYTIQILPYNLKSDGTKVYNSFYTIECGSWSYEFATGASSVDEPSCATTKYKMTVNIDYEESFKLLSLLNEERTKAGLSKLTMDKDLLDKAVIRCAEQLDVNSWGHTRPNGTACATLGGFHGENMYGCSSTIDVAESAANSWMGEPAHRANMLGSGWKSAGIAVMKYNGFSYVVADFNWDKATTVASQPKNGKRTVTIETKFPYTWVY